jgi:O-antigen/teichoic acid export membrane protein
VTEESPIRRLVGGVASLGAATLLTQILGFVALAVAARRLGPNPVGSFAFATSLVGYFAIPANFGVTALATRDIAQRPERAREVMAEVVALHGALVILPYIVVVAIAPWLGADELTVRLMPIVALGFVMEALSLQWVLYGRRRFGLIAVARVLGGILNFVLVLVLVDPGSGGDGAVAMAVAGAIGLTATTVVTMVAVLRREGRPPLLLDRRRLLGRFRLGMVLGISGVMISIYYSIDSVMLGYLTDTGEVGQYAVAYRLPLALIGLAALWASVLFPHASHLGVRDPEALRGQLGFFSSVAAIASLPMGVGAILVGEELMPQLFGPAFAPAGTPFIILAWAAAIVTFTISTGTVATALGEERHYVWAVAAGALANLLLNFAAIPLFGMVGAACATVAAEVVVFWLIWRRLHVRLGKIELEWWRITRALAATAVMVPAVIAVDGLVSPAGQAAVGAVVYAGAAYALGAVSAREIRMALRPQKESTHESSI